MAEAPESTRLKLQGVNLEVKRKGRGRTLLILHGGSGPISGLPFADRLAERFELIEPVHPGFNGSPIPEHFDHLEDLVYLYLDLMDALAVENTILMGHSMGGWAAAEIAVRTTQRIAKLILVDAVGIKAGGRDSRDIADVFAMPQEKINRLAWHDPALAPDFSTLGNEDMQRIASNRTALAMYTWDPYMHNPKLRGRLHRITVPSLLIWGASDGLVKTEYAKAYRDAIPNARLEVIANAGHSPHIEQPDAFVQQVIGFAG